MIWLRRHWLRVRALVARRRVEAELDEELRYHLEREAEENVRRGMAPGDARAAALRAFGGVERVKEECRDARGVRLLEDLAQDVRLGARALRRSPGFTAVVVGTLALGIGANTAIFSVVNGVLLRPLAYARPDELVMVWENDRISGTEREEASVPDFYDFRARARVFDRLAAFQLQQASLVAAGAEPERLEAPRVTHDLFATLGVRPLLGRDFREAEDRPGGDRVAVVSEEMWRGRFAAAPDVLGRRLRLDDALYTVVGVMPAEVDFPTADADLWVPLQHGPTTTPRSRHNVTLVARLKRGVTPAAAQREMDAIAAALEAEHPRENHGRGVFVEPLTDALVGAVRPALVVLLGAVALVLLIACANAANLLLARTAARRREVAVRVALGAGGGRLARQFVVEAMLLALAAALLGVWLASAGLQALLALAPQNLPRLSSVGIDWRVLAFTLGVSAAVALGLGVLPALQSRRLDLHESLKAERARVGAAGRGARRFQRALVVAELALSVVLVIGAGLLIKSFWTLRRVDPGFAPEGVLRVSLRLPPSRYPQDFAQYPHWMKLGGFYGELLRRLEALPEVRAAAVAASHPLDPGFTNSFVIEGREAEAANQPEISTRMVSPAYLRAAGVPLLRGRALAEQDGPGAPPVVLINEAGARRYFPNDDPIGHRVRFWGTMREIVGVLGNERFQGLGEDAPPAVYSPIAQTPLGSVTLLVRAAGDPSRLLPAVRREVWALDPDLALFDAATMEETLAQSVGRERFTMLLLGAFAAAAVVLALVGVHGVLSYAVVQRTGEIGLRMALGAARGDVVRLVVGQGLRLALAGTAAGVLGALAATRLLSGLLYGVAPTDAATYALVAASVLLVAAVASYLPARRATGIDPMIALRSEG